MSQGPVSDAILPSSQVHLTFPNNSPKPNLPTAKDYEMPEVPNRDLGPPPPGYGRYADVSMDRPPAGQNTFAAPPTGGFIRRNLEEVTCFKVSHFSSWMHPQAHWDVF
jgi:hypothetical protein